MDATAGNRPGLSVATWLLLAAVALLGIGQIAFLPPWEGFDEYAHWSSIQQIADTGTIPFYGRDHVSADVDHYAGPMPYASSAPFDRTGRPTYRSFRDSGGTLPDGPVDRAYVPGRELNWQAQHPPLYYALLAPVYRLVDRLPWPDHLLALRLASWTMVVAGLAAGILATARLAPGWGSAAAPVMAGYPMLVPQFFPEMARLGNDSLCLLLTGAAWALLLKLMRADGRCRDAVLLGCILGAGLLTKAFFVPITAGVAAALLARHLLHRDRSLSADLVPCLLAAAAIGGLWYFRNFLVFDNLLGTNDFIRLSKAGGLRAGLAENFSVLAYLRGLAAILGTYVWAGTWSLAQPPEYVILPPALLVCLCTARWALALRRMPAATRLTAALPGFLVLPILGGLAYHLLTVIAETGRGAGTPGWYLHILAAPIGAVLALGWSRTRWFAALAAASAAVGAVGWGLQLSLFSGCATKSGSVKYYDLSGAPCLIDGNQLATLGHPVTGALCMAVAVLLVGAALLASRRPMRPTAGQTASA